MLSLKKKRRKKKENNPKVKTQLVSSAHIVDGGHQEEDDADDVKGKDGSEENQHGVCAAERDDRHKRKLVTPLPTLYYARRTWLEG